MRLPLGARLAVAPHQRAYLSPKPVSTVLPANRTAIMAATAVMAGPPLNSLSCMTSFTIVICNPLGVWEILESNPYRRVAFLSGKGSALRSHPFLAQASGGRYFPLGHKTGTLIRIRRYSLAASHLPRVPGRNHSWLRQILQANSVSSRRDPDHGSRTRCIFHGR